MRLEQFMDTDAKYLQSEKEKNMPGKLYVCATPIGNLDDITYRVINTLKEVDLIAAEDTRHSMKLMTHFDIHTPLTSYHEHNKVEKAAQLVNKMIEGAEIAVITDAGTPAISDPGEELVRQAVAAGITVTSLPGACACITALTMSALPARRFVFEAFLPADKKERKNVLSELKAETRTIIIYEAPHHLRSTLAELYETLGERVITLCRELTKKHEECIYTTLEAAIKMYENAEPRGEYVLVINGADKDAMEEEKKKEYLSISIEEHMDMYMKKGVDKKEAMKLVAKDRGVSKREIYSSLIK
jgi:hypothetical protein